MNFQTLNRFLGAQPTTSKGRTALNYLKDKINRGVITDISVEAKDTLVLSEKAGVSRARGEQAKPVKHLISIGEDGKAYPKLSGQKDGHPVTEHTKLKNRLIEQNEQYWAARDEGMEKLSLHDDADLNHFAAWRLKNPDIYWESYKPRISE